ncbi:hypothetical protein [Patiriisocius hiemis]|uniref:Oxaloacetate decarboxylase n=1 Tax=Patiriisocius hiemis TaxID=3075604 RepID=A0ABU2YCK4_9FLAO|nr:hypothetical protein [Constantimarinum sp. W242]MDT0555919.1 hypothetical protein [Constantimarinum sp. W242]
MKALFLPLVDWGMGTIIIGVFALVCVILTAIVIGMMNSGKKNGSKNSNKTEEDELTQKK